MLAFQNYMQDGAHPSARAVLALLQGKHECINTEKDRHAIEVSRWCNVREQGYILSVKPFWYEVRHPTALNITWFEQKNSDDIVCTVWLQDSMDPLTVDNAMLGQVPSHDFNIKVHFAYNEHLKASDWILEKIESYLNSVK